MPNDTRCEPCGGTALPDDTNAARGCLNAIVVAVVLALLFFLLAGCSTVRPLAEFQHISHATQHFGSNPTNYGWDVASGGIRWRPVEGVTVDLLEGYSFEEMNGRHEVFTGRVTVEF